jgi:hypothetical protein
MVAEGLTKQHLGHIFERFRQDLGLKKRAAEKEKLGAPSTTLTSRV